MANPSETIGSKKESAILALLTSRSVEEAARTTNVPPRTLYRWLRGPVFDAAYRKARRDVLGQATARLQQGTGAAAAVILKLMVDPGVPASTRLRVADSVLTHAANGIGFEEIEARLAMLELAEEEASRAK